eukprot:scaffold674_cov130-Amphora_coffeaeformis.AAC.3
MCAFMKALFLQKRRRSRRTSPSVLLEKSEDHNKNKSSSSRRSSSRTCDDTASTVSQRGNAMEMAAQQGKWDSFIQQVQASSPMDWSVFSKNTNEHNNDGKVEVDDDVSLQEGIEVEISSVGSSSSTTTTTPSSCRQQPQPSQVVASSPMHLALRYRAPLQVLDALLSICQTDRFGLAVPEECQDEAGQTPLHVALAAGCGEEVVQRLLSGPTLLMPAVIHDTQQRTALHIACGSCGTTANSTTSVTKSPKKNRSFWGPDPIAMDIWNKRRAVIILLEQYPEAAGLPDAHGQTPLTYARAAGFSQITAGLVL